MAFTAVTPFQYADDGAIREVVEISSHEDLVSASDPPRFELRPSSPRPLASEALGTAVVAEHVARTSPIRVPKEKRMSLMDIYWARLHEQRMPRAGIPPDRFPIRDRFGETLAPSWFPIRLMVRVFRVLAPPRWLLRGWVRREKGKWGRGKGLFVQRAWCGF